MTTEIVWSPNGGVTERAFTPPAPEVPQVVTRRQAKLALLEAGLLDDVEELIAGADRATQIAWNDALEFHRHDPLVLAIGAQLPTPLTTEQIDDLFISAGGKA